MYNICKIKKNRGAILSRMHRISAQDLRSRPQSWRKEISEKNLDLWDHHWWSVIIGSLMISDHWWSVIIDDQWSLMLTDHWWSVIIDDHWSLMIINHWWSLIIDDQWSLMISDHWWSLIIRTGGIWPSCLLT